MEVIGGFFIVALIFAMIGGSPESVIPVAGVTFSILLLVGLILEFTGIDFKIVGGVSFVLWVYIIYRMRKAQKNWEEENRKHNIPFTIKDNDGE